MTCTVGCDVGKNSERYFCVICEISTLFKVILSICLCSCLTTPVLGKVIGYRDRPYFFVIFYQAISKMNRQLGDYKWSFPQCFSRVVWVHMGKQLTKHKAHYELKVKIQHMYMDKSGQFMTFIANVRTHACTKFL